ncbi:tRNA CCA-pyrophosphorylase [Companilactobacillus tucceti DSM 20183]|uniref:CCA-adding enzyme n=1 Tax=Companilactobacillus tucceti DSM 20183 TaxID=1423811 RepID=A0A0R1J1Z3_9LACO|nr:CCA tRNA nucleotidyltransferase [Companilactobacillus tucceti]KRK65502.1 tRNA CCA-pyrophosphorylase [Companilactobacillus tucceti DSM 20183]
MRMKELPADFKRALPVLKEIEQAGYEAYFVGGSVRDHILGLPIHDVDIATSAYPEEIKEIFKHTVDTGIQHGTVTVLFGGSSYEITTFRTESGYQDYRRPDEVTFVRSLEDDLKRRDFTINALALDRNGEVIDKFDGLKDLNNHLIRAVGKAEERFNEDALRMMRAVRFQSQLNFRIEDKTAEAIKSNAHLLEKIAVERTREEFIKMMLGQAWQIGFSDFLRFKLCEFAPGMREHSTLLHKLIELKPVEFLDEDSVWVAIGFALKLSDHDLNKLLRVWKVSNKTRETSLATYEMLELFSNQNFDIWEIYNLGIDNFERAAKLCQLFSIKMEYDKISKSIEQIPIKSSHDLAITGNDLIKILNITPGPEIGKMLKNVEKAVVEENVCNNFDELKVYVLSNR